MAKKKKQKVCKCPEIDNCKNCQRYERGTREHLNSDFCMRKGYINPDNIKDCKEHKKKKPVKTFYYGKSFNQGFSSNIGADGYNWQDDYFYRGY